MLDRFCIHMEPPMLPSDPHQSDSGYVPEAMDSRQSLEGILPRGTKIDLTNPQTIWKLAESHYRRVTYCRFVVRRKEVPYNANIKHIPQLTLPSKLGGLGSGSSPENSDPQIDVLYFHHLPKLLGTQWAILPSGTSIHSRVLAVVPNWLQG